LVELFPLCLQELILCLSQLMLLAHVPIVLTQHLVTLTELIEQEIDAVKLLRL
jgi:hypothetical protein